MSAHLTRPIAVRLDQCDWLPCTEANYSTRKSALFVSLSDFAGIAGQSYLAAVRCMEPDRGETWLRDDGLDLIPWSAARDFHEHLVAEISEALYRHAHVTGHFVAGAHAAWRLPDHDDDDAPGCRGGTPAVMGHGRPALVPAVGPAPVVSESCATALPADPLLPGLPMQELPVGGPSLPVDIICAKEANQ